MKAVNILTNGACIVLCCITPMIISSAEILCGQNTI